MYGPSCNSVMQSMVSPAYNKDVLMGNWAERRYGTEEQSNAILPGLHVHERCEQHRTVSQDTYTDEPFKGDDVKRYFLEKRMTAYRNLHKGSASSVRLRENSELKRNFTTTYTLGYEIFPQRRLEQCLESTAEKKPEVKANLSPEIDMLQCFGNLTKTGATKNWHCAQVLEKWNRMQTTYAAAYNRMPQSGQSKPVFNFGPDYDGVVKFDIVC